VRNLVTNTLALLVIGGLCGLALTQTNQLTREPVEANRVRQAQALLSELLGQQAPTDLNWQNGVANPCGPWQFVRGAANGYSGHIHYLALLEKDSIRLRVTRHQETPGIADFINHQVDPYLPNLDDTSIADWGDLDNITGATITHKALRGMAAQAQTLVNHQQERDNCEQSNES
jgi:Na+-translocating ferredoxin:NAD+ oxidoreductase RnfG subunit